MIRIYSPASSANLGPGFDCLGIAFDIYNQFDVELSEKDILVNMEERFNNEDNLFLKAYRFCCEAIGVQDHIKVTFDCHVPVSRGLGSSAAFIVPGIKAASALHNNALSDDEIFQLASKMEGHPDNIAPCFFGGLTASMQQRDGTYLTAVYPVSPRYHFYVCIPDFEVDTKEARRQLPDQYPRSTVVSNTSKAIFVVQALQNGAMDWLIEASQDKVHEPYRQPLITGFNEMKAFMNQKKEGVFLISGSGSTCLFITDKDLTYPEQITIDGHLWKIQKVHPSRSGTYAMEV